MSVFDKIRVLIQSDLTAVEVSIRDILATDAVPVRNVAQDLIDCGGKRLRPMLLLLVAKAVAASKPVHFKLAAIVELMHSATLIHDDILDGAVTRRGKASINSLCGNAFGVLTGDFVCVRALGAAAELNCPEVFQSVFNTASSVLEGALHEYNLTQLADIQETEYLGMVKNKTAALFRASCELGLIQNDVEDSWAKAVSSYGLNLGMAFQLMDDVLDVNEDVVAGKCTLPLIYALRQYEYDHNHCAMKNHEHLFEAVKVTNALSYTKQQAATYTAAAVDDLRVLPDSKYKDALIELAQVALQRYQ